MSEIYLLDVNILVAALMPTHVHHDRVQKWLGQFARSGWATCPIIECGVVRILSNPALGSAALSVTDAIGFLAKNLDHPAHHFWPDEIGVGQAVTQFAAQLRGHQQLSDAYLLGLAIHKNARFATTDRRVLHLLPEGSSQRSRVVIV